MSNWTGLPIRRIHPPVALLSHFLQPHGCYIAGGYARWACSTREDTPIPKDIDVICPSRKSLESARASFKTNNLVEVRDGEFSVTFKSPMISREIQLLKPFTGDSVEECLSKFDLSVCRVALVNHDSAVGDQDGVEDERLGRVRVAHIDPETVTNTLCRLMRYANKGYQIEKGEVDKVVDFIRRQAVKDHLKDTPPPPLAAYDRSSSYDHGS